MNPGDALRLQRTQFNMTNHTPTPERIERIERVREHMKRMAAILYVNCPESRERAVALTKMEEVLMWATASIAREKWADEELATKAEIAEARERLSGGKVEVSDAPTG